VWDDPWMEHEPGPRRVEMAGDTDPLPFFSSRSDTRDDVRARSARCEVRDRGHSQVAFERKGSKCRQCEQIAGSRMPFLQEGTGKRGAEDHSIGMGEGRIPAEWLGPCSYSPSGKPGDRDFRSFSLRLGTWAPGADIRGKAADEIQRRICLARDPFLRLRRA
jgi:hypothetical protein